MTITHDLLLGCFLLVLITTYPAHAQKVTSLASLGLKPKEVEIKFRKFGINNRGMGAPRSGSSKGKFAEQLIYNGNPTYVMEFKYQISIVVNTTNGLYHICGGVLIDERHIVTAAHCLQFLDRYDHFIAAGIHNITLGEDNPGAQIHPLNDTEIHPKYNGVRPGFLNDIAIVRVAEDFVESSYVQYAVLATKDMGSFDRRYCVVTGWGETENGYPDILQFGYQYIPTLQSCKLFWAIDRHAKVTKRHVCGYNYPTSSCFGDSGGPLSCDGVVVGIVSWGLENCSGCFPGVYTRIAFHTKWILKVMGIMSP